MANVVRRRLLVSVDETAAPAVHTLCNNSTVIKTQHTKSLIHNFIISCPDYFMLVSPPRSEAPEILILIMVSMLHSFCIYCISWLRASYQACPSLLQFLTHLPEGAHSPTDWRPREKLLSWCCNIVLHPRPCSDPEELQHRGSPDSPRLEPEHVDRRINQSAIGEELTTTHLSKCVLSVVVEVKSPAA